MKMTKRKLGLLGLVGIGAFVVTPTIANAEASRVPEAVNGKITLTENVTIGEIGNQIKNAKGSTLTIDLNGFKLTRDGYYGYLIDNKGVLNIVDSSTAKTGNIECMMEPNDPANPSSCIRNYDTLDVDGIKVKAYFTAIKNEEASTLSIKNSTVESTLSKAGTVMNYGEATIDKSNIIASEKKDGTAIFALTYVEGDKVYSSNTKITNTNLSAYWPINMQQSDRSVPLKDGETIQVTFTNGTIDAAHALARIQGVETKPDTDAISLKMNGNITGPSKVLEYAESGTTLTLNSGIDEDITIKKGVKLIVPKDMAEKEQEITLEEGAILVNNTGENLPVKLLVNGEKKDAEVNAGDSFENKKIDTPEENPKTFDGITGYGVLLVAGIGALVGMLKKKFN